MTTKNICFHILLIPWNSLFKRYLLHINFAMGDSFYICRLFYPIIYKSNRVDVNIIENATILCYVVECLKFTYLQHKEMTCFLPTTVTHLGWRNVVVKSLLSSRPFLVTVVSLALRLLQPHNLGSCTVAFCCNIKGHSLQFAYSWYVHLVLLVNIDVFIIICIYIVYSYWQCLENYNNELFISGNFIMNCIHILLLVFSQLLWLICSAAYIHHSTESFIWLCNLEFKV